MYQYQSFFYVPKYIPAQSIRWKYIIGICVSNGIPLLPPSDYSTLFLVLSQKLGSNQQAMHKKNLVLFLFFKIGSIFMTMIYSKINI